MSHWYTQWCIINVIFGSIHYLLSCLLTIAQPPDWVYSNFIVVGPQYIPISLKIDLGLSNLVVVWPLYILISVNLLVIPVYKVAQYILVHRRFALGSTGI